MSLTREFAGKIREISDAELERRISATYHLAFYESYGNDHEARADAMQEYTTLVREKTRRKSEHPR
jgi:hypothetical protein